MTAIARFCSACSVALAFLSGASGACAQPVAPIPGMADTGRWNPVLLDTSVDAGTASDYRRSHDEDRAATAYLYALPAFMQYRQRFQFLSYLTRVIGDRGSPFGQFMLLRQPASLKTTDPFPNVDTLYGAAFLELREQPMVLKMPEIPGRYFSLALLDAYFYHFAYIGSRTTGQGAGTYLIAGPDWRGELPPGIDQVIRAPTNSMHIYQRIYFRNLEDIANVTRLQDRITLTPLARFLDPAAPIRLPDPAAYLTENPLAVMDSLDVLRIANRHMTDNPPPLPDRTLVESFASLGVGPGASLPGDDYVRSVLRRGAVRASQTMTALAQTERLSRTGWLIPSPRAGQRGGPDGVALQAMHQLRYIGINVSAEAVYLTAYADSAQQNLRGGRKYVIRFAAHELPPLRADRFGFWSITLYDKGRSQFVANPADKYAVRSGDPLVLGLDGSLTLYVQPEPPDDPATRANWLPVPPAGEFGLMLRIYVGGEEVVEGRYIPPAIVAAP